MHIFFPAPRTLRPAFLITPCCCWSKTPICYLISKSFLLILATWTVFAALHLDISVVCPWVNFPFRFFCALHPTMRQDWARTWAKLIKPGGYLVTLEWPIRPDDKTGPPWPVSPQIYSDLLVPLGEPLIKLRLPFRWSARQGVDEWLILLIKSRRWELTLAFKTVVGKDWGTILSFLCLWPLGTICTW